MSREIDQADIDALNAYDDKLGQALYRSNDLFEKLRKELGLSGHQIAEVLKAAIATIQQFKAIKNDFLTFCNIGVLNASDIPSLNAKLAEEVKIDLCQCPECYRNIDALNVYKNLYYKLLALFSLKRNKMQNQFIGLKPYNPGQLDNCGGENVEWWQDYIRNELRRAHIWYEEQVQGV